MSDASRVQLTYKPETVFGETIPAPEVMLGTRFVSENLKHANATVVSEELRSDRSRSDLLLVGTDVAGDIVTEFSFLTFEDWLISAMCTTGGAWTANVAKNGTTLQSYRIQRANLDLPTYFIYQGCCINGFHLDITARAIVKATWNWMGAATTARATPNQASSVTAAAPNTIITAGPSIDGTDLNPNMTGAKCTALRLDIMNNLRPRPDIESTLSAQYGMGVQDVTGTCIFYFQNLSVYSIFLANTSQAFSFDVKDPNSVTKKYTFLMPKLKWTDVEIITPGVEQDVLATANFRALWDSASSCHLQVTRVPT